jgi:hypothetical protein
MPLPAPLPPSAAPVRGRAPIGPTRRQLLATLPSGLFLAPARAAATQDAWSILHQTEAKYRAALAYDVQMMSAGSMEVGMLGSRWGARLAAVAPDHFLAEIPVMGPYRIDPRAAVHKWLIVGDGRSVFFYRPTLNEYTEEVYRHLPDSPPRITEGAKLFQRSHEEHFERFRSLATRPQREPRLRGEKTIKVFDRRVPCLQIDTHSIQKSGGHRWSEKLWLDPNNYWIIQSLRGRLHLTGDRKARLFRYTQTQYDWHTLGAELPPETFRFVPPEGAKLVERFTWIPRGPVPH